ncbi:hypothetical protein DJ568_03050 [Mucilaginibacter hurinus]|uniref:Rieske domain-containing protein n=1 Tax=Mucilaginibacter hurinus TaxID=2201324 RepID=A0A367GUG5_9SPHI|nr:Rieske (2Fe-2S) protein [Mucilaginibacter hurinus]RCH56848.1 hypothetical protein DJ568_03050 [Mucilaginibacter hurinus]
MKRRDFLLDACIACTAGLAGLMTACTSYHYVTAKMVTDGLLIPIDLLKPAKEQRNFFIVRHEQLRFPVAVFRLDEATYTALWMQCAHQGAELQVAGNQLVCPAHGSEYDRNGKVTQGPAVRDLRKFPVSITGSDLFIDLRKARS